MLSAAQTRWRYLRAGILAVVLWTPLHATAATASERQNVIDIRPLLIMALDRGEAHGVLVGDAAKWAAQYFKTTAPIEIDVKTVKPLSRPGCTRLAITTAQEGVWDFNREERASTPERKAFTWLVNYCRDGTLPSEGPK